MYQTGKIKKSVNRFLLILITGIMAITWGCDSDSSGTGSASLKVNADGLTDIEQTPYWGQTPWVSIHRDSRNSDYTPFVATADNQIKWEALEGAAILIAPAIATNGNVYVTTGRGPGYSSLHAFDPDGNILWESEKVDGTIGEGTPEGGTDKLDSHAVSSGVMIDKDGYLYISDQNEFWSYTSDGAVRWVTDISALGATSGFISAMITNEGYVGGVTLNGLVMLFNRNDGSLALPVLDLPGGDGPERYMNTPGVWAGGLMDPAIVDFTMDWFLGFNAEICNTPAIHPETGRIYINGASRIPEDGVLYGIDIVDGKLEIAFETLLGGGSGTSATISPDNKQIYAVSGDGTLVAIDTTTGEKIWSLSGAGAAASPAVGSDGVIYSGSAFNEFDNGPGFLLAVNPDGTIKWKVMCNDLFPLADLLPTLDPYTPNGIPFIQNGAPTARTNGIVTVTGKKIFLAFTLGYDFFNPNSKRLIHLAHKVAYTGLDSENGKPLGTIEVRDTNEANISIGSDGSHYYASASIFGSISYYGLDQILPPAYKTPAPTGGIVALEPVSVRNLIIEGIDWVRELNEQTIANLDSDSSAVITALRRGLSQLEATADSVSDAETRGEITTGLAESSRTLILEAQQALVDAKANFNAGKTSKVKSLIGSTEVALIKAGSLLE